MIKKLIAILIISGLFLPSFGFAQDQQAPLKSPATGEEMKSLGLKILEGLPQALKKVGQEALGIWKKMADWFFSNVWEPWLKSKIQAFWQSFHFKEEFRKELQETKEDIFRLEKIIWQKLRDWIKK